MTPLELAETIQAIENLSDDGLSSFIECSDDLKLKRFAMHIKSKRSSLRVEEMSKRYTKPVDNYQKAFDSINIDI